MIEYTNFFKLLLENDEKKLTDFLLSNGKGAKIICPIMFIKEDKEDDRDGKSDSGN